MNQHHHDTMQAVHNGKIFHRYPERERDILCGYKNSSDEMVEIYICSKSYIWSAVFGSALDKSEIPIWFSQSDGTNPLVQIVFPTTGVKWNTTATSRTELQQTNWNIIQEPAITLLTNISIKLSKERQFDNLIIKKSGIPKIDKDGFNRLLKGKKI